MKRQFLFSVLLGLVLNLSAQVGINTDEPTAMLDVNGSLRVRGVIDTDNGSTRSAGAVISHNKVLVLDDDGNVYFDTKVVKNSFVRGGSSNDATSLISLGGNLLGWNKINFDTIFIDENNEYDTDIAEFVAKTAGIYAVYVQYVTSSLISASNVGVGILKRKAGETTYTLDSQESFTNISVLNISVSPPTRKVFTITYLDKGDAVCFGSSGLSLSVQLKGDVDSYFTIFQIK